MAQIILDTYNDGRDDITKVLELVVKHNNGKYAFHCNVLELTEHFKRWTTGQKGDFYVSIAEGRKSQKKLDTYNSFIERNKNALFDLWKQEEYITLAECVRDLKTTASL